MTVTPTELPVDYTAVLATLGLRGSDPKAQAVVLVCQRYSLDPILKHVVLVDGNVYITRDGLLHVAHATGQLDGIEVSQAVLSEDGKEWRSTASVWRKDMSRPTSLSGRHPAGKKNSPEMAEKVAVARSLRHAFDVAIATEDERQSSVTTATRESAQETLVRRQQPAEIAAVPGVVADASTGEVTDWPETAKPADA